MKFLVLKAYLELIHFDVYLARRNFRALYDEVRNCPIRCKTPLSGAVERICAAVDMACIWYWKEALCLQRSAATACLLKRNGVPAQMVIGAQQMPFKAHGQQLLPQGRRQCSLPRFSHNEGISPGNAAGYLAIRHRNYLGWPPRQPGGAHSSVQRLTFNRLGGRFNPVSSL
jgi:hypothetical protein